VWGLDLVGPLQKAPGGYTHLLVAIDKFSKWIEVRPLNSIRSEQEVAFFTNTLQGPPLRRGGWVPHVMQAGSEEKKPNRRARCVQPPSGYKRLSTFSQTSGRKGGAMQAACNHAKWVHFSDSQHAQHGGPGPRVMQPARRMLHACNCTTTCATTTPPRLRSQYRDSRRPSARPSSASLARWSMRPKMGRQ
jgi:hypothetical protein